MMINHVQYTHSVLQSNLEFVRIIRGTSIVTGLTASQALTAVAI